MRFPTDQLQNGVEKRAILYNKISTPTWPGTSFLKGSLEVSVKFQNVGYIFGPAIIFEGMYP